MARQPVLREEAALQVLQVGKPYLPGKTAWPEALEYTYYQGGHILRIFMRTPSPEEVEAIWSGAARFGLYVSGDVIFLCFRFYTEAGVLAFHGEAPYTWHLVSPEDKGLPDLDFDPDIGAALSVVLVDAENGLIEALRVLAFSHKFSKRLHQAIHGQAPRPFDADDYERQVANVYARYTSKKLWRICEVMCKAGERD